MSHPRVAAVVLAAGKGTRFKSELAKVLHPAAGRSMLRHVLEALRPLDLGQIVVVVGHQREDVEAEAAAAGMDQVVTALQERQLGTGHATEVALDALAEDIEQVMVLPGDAPLLTSAVLDGLLDAAEGTVGSLLTTELEEPSGYGRVVRTSAGHVERIVEHDDATPEQREINEVNAGMYVFDVAPLREALADVDADNAQGERYLTDVVEILVETGHDLTAHIAPADAVRGVNDRSQLGSAARVLRLRRLEHLMTEVGVTVVDPDSTFVDVGVEVGRDTILHPGCRLRGETTIGSEVELGPNADLTDTLVEDGAVVRHTVAESASIGPAATVGPFTYLRPGTRLERGAKAGGFVEIKKSTVGEDSKVPHLSYVGDATIGKSVNFSAAAVTVNYDGYEKHQTVIEDGAFIGCDTMLVAPVTVGEGAIVAAGSTITDDVPADALAIARQRQSVKDGWAKQRRESRE